MWLSALGDGPSTSAASVATDSNHDAYLTKESGAISKIAATGAVLWTRPFGSVVAVTPDDRVFIAGSFTGSLELDAVTLSSADDIDAYVAELDADGNVLGATLLGGEGDQVAAALVVVGMARAVVSGPGLGVAAVDPDGSVAWRQPFVGSVSATSEGELLMTGGFSGTVAMGSETLESTGGTDVFVARLDSAGEVLFARRFGDAGLHQEGQAIAADADGNVLVAGTFDGTLAFGSETLSTASCPKEVWCKTSGFVAKLDAKGEPVWSQARGPLRSISGVAPVPGGGVLVSGAEPGGVEPYRMPYLLAFDADGGTLWTRREWPETGLGSGHGVALDACGDALWAVSARSDLKGTDQAFLAKIVP